MFGKEKEQLDDPRVEWQVWEVLGVNGYTDWHWRVAVGDQQTGGERMFKDDAFSDARHAARRLLGEGIVLGRTRPCALCGNPSRVGTETDTDQCAALLKKARAELAELPSAVI